MKIDSPKTSIIEDLISSFSGFEDATFIVNMISAPSDFAILAGTLLVTPPSTSR